MTDHEALQIITDFIGEASSFIETFDHEFHDGQDDDGNPLESDDSVNSGEVKCRFDYPLDDAISTIAARLV